MNKNGKQINQEEINIKKIKYLDMQLLAIAGFIVALCISFLLSYDKKLSLENKETLFDNETAQNVALFQTILVFVISASFLYINYKRYDLSYQLHDDDEKDQLLQVETSIFSVISAIIGLYIVFKNYHKRNITTSETELL